MASLKQNSSFSNLVVKQTATLTWTIENFAQVVEAASPYFSPINSGHKFILELNATNRAFRLDRVFLELMYNQHQKEVTLCYRISILDADEVKHYTKEYFWKFQEANHGLCEFNVTSYISRNRCNEFLVNGNLKIYCEVDILGEKSDQLPSQQNKEPLFKLSEDLETLLEGGKWTDLIVQIGDKQFRVHANILAARSPVFAAMFEHDCEEKEQNKVNITEMDVEVCAEMLRFVYSGKVKSMEKYAMELLEAADKYQMDSLKTMCEQYLSSNLSIETAANVLILADMHRANGLKSKCIQYITDNANQVKDTQAWKVLNSSAHYKLLGELFLHSSTSK